MIKSTKTIIISTLEDRWCGVQPGLNLLNIDLFLFIISNELGHRQSSDWHLLVWLW